MSGQWAGRPSRPPEWHRLARKIRVRDKETCQLCGLPGRDVDHIDPRAGDEEWNLRVLCRPCHNRKSSAEGNAAHPAKLYPIFRAPEEHPGLL